MHYYIFNIADYRKDTGHLSTLEHGIYRQLLDWYYLDEKPIPKETQSVLRRLRLGSESDALALQNVLNDFFVLRDDGYHQVRCDVEIKDYHHKAEVNKANGKRGGRPKKTQSVILANPNESETKANETLTSNHKPITNNQKPVRETASPNGSRLPTDWSLPDDWALWAKEARPELNPHETAQRFADYWHGVAGAKGRKADWLATWRNWVRGEKATVGRGQSPSFAERTEQLHRDRAAEFMGRSTTQTVIDITPTLTRLEQS